MKKILTLFVEVEVSVYPTRGTQAEQEKQTEEESWKKTVAAITIPGRETGPYQHQINNIIKEAK